MKEQTTLSEKRRVADGFIEKVDPYHTQHHPYRMDLRAYTKYISDNNINPFEITDDMMMRFATPLQTEVETPIPGETEESNETKEARVAMQKLSQLIQLLLGAGRISDVDLATKDEKARERFFKEFRIA